MISMDSESYKMRDYGDAASEQRAMVVFSNITHPSRRPLFVLSSILVFRSVFLPSFPPSNNSSISFPANSKADLAEPAAKQSTATVRDKPTEYTSRDINTTRWKLPRSAKTNRAFVTHEPKCPTFPYSMMMMVKESGLSSTYPILVRRYQSILF